MNRMERLYVQTMDDDVATMMIGNGYVQVDSKCVDDTHTLYTFEYNDNITKKFSKVDLEKFKGKVTFTKKLSMFM